MELAFATALQLKTKALEATTTAQNTKQNKNDKARISAISVCATLL